MGYSSKEETYWSGVSLAANYDGQSIETRNVACGEVALVWSGAAATDATVKLQESIDGSTWFDISTMSKTIAAASGSGLFKLTRDILMSSYIRAVLTKNSETTGTVTIKFLLKGDR